jgi:hypothetical protein
MFRKNGRQTLHGINEEGSARRLGMSTKVDIVRPSSSFSAAAREQIAKHGKRLMTRRSTASWYSWRAIYLATAAQYVLGSSCLDVQAVAKSDFRVAR